MIIMQTAPKNGIKISIELRIDLWRIEWKRLMQQETPTKMILNSIKVCKMQEKEKNNSNKNIDFIKKENIETNF